MKLLSITGKEENIDEFVAEYLLDSGIQTEDAVKVYEKSWKLANFEYDSTAKDLLKKCKALLDKYKIRYNVNIESEKIEKNLDYIDRVIADIKNSLDNLENGISDKKKSLEEYRKKAELYNNTKDLDNINIILDCYVESFSFDVFHCEFLYHIPSIYRNDLSCSKFIFYYPFCTSINIYWFSNFF